MQKKIVIRNRLQANSVTLQTSSLRGQEHYIIPCVMLVEGVLHSANAENPALALASEFGISPDSWNGRPIVYNHPKINDAFVSANLPEIWDDGVIGQLFGSGLSDNNELQANLWLDSSRAPQELIDGFKAGTVFEVSTGLYATEEEASGTYDGKDYSVIWRNISPDHLAILQEGSIGACSVDDGCGAMRTNTSKTQATNIKEYFMNEETSVINCDGCKGKGGGGKGGGGKKGEEVIASEQGLLRTFLASVPKRFRTSVSKFLRNNQKPIIANELSDIDIRNAIKAALSELEQYSYCYIEAVFSKTVVFSAMEMTDYEWSLFQVSYSVAEGGAITIGTDFVEVRPETYFVPVVITGSSSEDDGNSGTGAGGDTPVSNGVVSNVSNSSGEIMELSQAQMDSIALNVAEKLKTLQSATTTTTTITQGASETAATAAVTELDNATKEAIAFATNVRKGLITDLVANGYTEEELKSISLAVLQKMAVNKGSTSNTATSYTGAAGSNVTQNNQNASNEAFTTSMLTFERKSA